MKGHNDAHLQEEQIIWAVIDVKELGEDTRHHLLACSPCQERVERFQAELQDFGRQAKEAVPPFSRTIKLPIKEPATRSQNAGWLPFIGATAMAGLVLFFYVMGGMGTVHQGKLAMNQSQEMLLEDEALMREISEMVEYPFTDDMYEITGENGSGFDEDFMEFIVPDIQDDFQSELIMQGGIKRC